MSIDLRIQCPAMGTEVGIRSSNRLLASRIAVLAQKSAAGKNEMRMNTIGVCVLLEAMHDQVGLCSFSL